MTSPPQTGSNHEGKSKEKAIVLKYRTRFHHEIIYSNLSISPGQSFNNLVIAVGSDEPKGFLPTPWPPEILKSREDVLTAACLKMVAIINVGLWWPLSDATTLNERIDKIFPKRSALGNSAVTDAEVCLLEDGDVVYSVGNPNAEEVDPSLHITESGAHPFLKAMIMLSLQRFAENSLSSVVMG